MDLTEPRNFLIAEGHLDNFELNERRARREKNPLGDGVLPRLLAAGITVVFLPLGGDGAHQRDHSERPLHGTLDVLDLFMNEQEKVPEAARIILSKKDIPPAPDPQRVWFVMELEGGHPLQEDYSAGKNMERKLAYLRTFYRLGIRSIQLTHNGRNELGDGIDDDATGGRLSKFGVAVVKEMNRLGMLIGVSHLSDAGFFHALEVSSTPIVATHSNCRALYNHPRNLSDAQLKAIAAQGGVAGMHYLQLMVPDLQLESFMQHLDHAVAVAGAEHVSIVAHGFDPIIFPGVRQRIAPDEPPQERTPAEEYHDNLVIFLQAMVKHGYHRKEMESILGGNLVRVLAQALH